VYVCVPIVCAHTSHLAVLVFDVSVVWCSLLLAWAGFQASVFLLFGVEQGGLQSDVRRAA